MLLNTLPDLTMVVHLYHALVQTGYLGEIGLWHTLQPAFAYEFFGASGTPK
jgi:hypothetical protein